MYYILFWTHLGNQTRHTGDPVEHTGPFFSKVTYSKDGVPSEMFYTDDSLNTVFSGENSIDHQSQPRHSCYKGHNSKRTNKKYRLTSHRKHFNSHQKSQYLLSICYLKWPTILKWLTAFAFLRDWWLLSTCKATVRCEKNVHNSGNLETYFNGIWNTFTKLLFISWAVRTVHLVP
jgi:hypothetical protein